MNLKIMTKVKITYIIIIHRTNEIILEDYSQINVNAKAVMLEWKLIILNTWLGNWVQERDNRFVISHGPAYVNLKLTYDRALHLSGFTQGGLCKQFVILVKRPRFRLANTRIGQLVIMINECVMPLWKVSQKHWNLN